MLDVRDLKKGFGSGRRRLEVLKGIDLEIKSGELVALMGPSGCGKSTLGRMVAGILKPSAGEIRYKGSLVSAMEKDEGVREASILNDNSFS